MKGDFYLGAWLVQPSLGRVSLDGRTVQVRPKVMDLLVHLAGSPGIVISKETLLNEVWRTEAISESALTRTITELRRAVGDDADQPRFLETIPKRGYRLIAPVSLIASPEQSRPRRRRPVAVAIGFAGLLLGASIALLISDYSPDGARIAFASNRSGNWEIWMADADGANSRQLTSFAGAPAHSPRWSPNGRLLAFAHTSEGNADIYTITPEGSLVRRLTVEPSQEDTPSWSRDGRWLYFSSNRSGTFEIWKVDVHQPVQPVQVTHGGGTNPFESADGQHLFYKKGEATDLEIWSRPISGSEESRVLGPIHGAPAGAWVPDPHGIYFIGPTWRIAYYRFATGATTPVVRLPQDAVVASPGLALSPDGRWLLYGQRDRSVSDIMLVEPFR